MIMSPSTIVSLGCYLLAAIIFFADMVFPADLNLPVLYVVVVLISSWHSASRFTWGMAIIGTLLGLTGTICHTGSSTNWASALWNLALALGAVWTTALVIVERNHIAQQKEQAIRERDQVKEEVMALSRLLPMCAWCKKICDDQGHWDGIEVYLTKETHQSITHGVCPDCAKKLEEEAREMGGQK